MMSELCHNLAITFWITANSYWMISEFLHFDTVTISGIFTYKHITLFPFSAGIIILGFYYIYWWPAHKHDIETM